MKPNTQALIWTILMWTIIIFIGLFTLMAFAVDPYQTPYTDASILKMIAFITSPFLVIWLIGTTIIYMLAYIKKK